MVKLRIGNLVTIQTIKLVNRRMLAIFSVLPKTLLDFLSVNAKISALPKKPKPAKTKT